VRLTTTDEIYTLMGRFSKSVPLDDSPNSFFTILRDTFHRLAEGEHAAAEGEGLAPVGYPSFGESTDDDSVAKAFYSRWSSFSTRLSFSWKDKWRLSDAPSRQVRRIMEKENKKLRDDAIREFNDAVRSLVIFVRKRDPRYVPNSQSEDERQKILRESAAAQAARSRAANQEKMNNADAVPEWAQSRGDEANLGQFSETEDESEVEHIECVVCNKIFKSENQFEAHEKSKKHLKAVQQLRRQMRKEDATFDLAQEIDPIPGAQPSGKQQTEPALVDGQRAVGTSDGIVGVLSSRASSPSSDELKPQAETDAALPAFGPRSSVADSEDDEYASRDAVEARLTGKIGSFSGSNDGEEVSRFIAKASVMTVRDDAPPKRIGMAKAKKQRKAARQAAAQQEGHPVGFHASWVQTHAYASLVSYMSRYVRLERRAFQAYKRKPRSCRP
jgi:DnaJ homolog subfamily A member 5